MSGKVLVSACLLGELVRHDGRHKRIAHPILQRWLDERLVVPVCPEIAGGLPVPRPAAEIERGAGGQAVLDGAARVRDVHGADVTPAFVAGAQQALALARASGARVAVLKARSPSCGVRVHMLASSCAASSKPQTLPTRDATASPKSCPTRWSCPL